MTEVAIHLLFLIHYCGISSPLIDSNVFTSGFTLYNIYWGRILGRYWDKSLESFPPCYSQSPLLTNLTQIFRTELGVYDVNLLLCHLPRPDPPAFSLASWMVVFINWEIHKDQCVTQFICSYYRINEFLNIDAVLRSSHYVVKLLNIILLLYNCAEQAKLREATPPLFSLMQFAKQVNACNKMLTWKQPKFAKI